MGRVKEGGWKAYLVLGVLLPAHSHRVEFVLPRVGREESRPAQLEAVAVLLVGVGAAEVVCSGVGEVGWVNKNSGRRGNNLSRDPPVGFLPEWWSSESTHITTLTALEKLVQPVRGRL